MSFNKQYDFALRAGAVGLASAMYRRQQQARNRFAYRRTGPGVRAAAAARKTARARTQTKRRRNLTTGVGVTTQHDARLVYRKRTMPRYKRLRWRGFVNKVHAVSERELGTQQIVFNQLQEFSNSTSGNQVVADLSLYSFRSGTQSRFDDMNQLAALIATQSGTTDTGLQVGASSKILFQSAVLDITVRNSSFITSTSAPDSRARLEVDVYELTFTKGTSDISADYAQLRGTGLLSQNAAQTIAIGGGATTEIAIERRGCTPFDLSYVCSKFGMKIWKKTKYQLGNGDQFTYQLRDPGRKTCTFRDLTQNDGMNRVGWTKFVLMVARSAPGLSVGATPGVDITERVSVGFTRKYVYKIENMTEDRTAYISL